MSNIFVLCTALNTTQNNPQNKRNLLKTGAFSLFLSLFLISCAENKTEESLLQQTLAPQSNEEAGTIVQGASQEEVISFLNETGFSARMLHLESGMYEVFSKDLKQIQSAFPQAQVVQNVYIENLLIDGAPSVNKLLSQATLLEKMTGDLKMAEQDPKKCLRNQATGPAPKIHNKKVEGYFSVDHGGIYELTEKKPVVFSAQNSLRSPEGSMFLWQIVSPHGSSVTKEVLKAKEIEFVPDMPGAFLAVLLVIDPENNCNFAQSIFALTVNNEKKKSKQPREFVQKDREVFHHLSLINAEESWVISKGEGVKIAVIDTGVNYNHPDLIQNIYINENEIPKNGIDDDGNGFIDDVYGWDFVHGDAFPFDDQGHGTHVAGLAASGVAGVAPKAQIIPIKGLNAFGGGDIASLAAAIMYSVDIGADIINMSLGGTHPSFEIGLKLAMDYAEEKGVIVVAAAGNGHPVFGMPMDNDLSPVYPATMKNKNIIAVAATDKNHSLTEYSNYGKKSVHIAAPGGSSKEGDLPLMATYYWPIAGKGNHYIGFSGTSMAAPVSAGAVALLKSMKMDLSVPQIKHIFNMTSKKNEELKDKIASEGVIDALSSVAYLTYAETVGGLFEEYNAVIE